MTLPHGELGFTGTSRGMTPHQMQTFRTLLEHVTILHLGDCVGSDEEAYGEAKMRGVLTAGHPPTDPKLRAFLGYDHEYVPQPYLTRNRAIVEKGTNGLIATPKDYAAPFNLRGEGTWTTIKYAEEAGRPIWIIWPNGEVFEREEVTR